MSVANRILAELKGDKVIWMIVIVLSVFSILTVYSATGTIAYREYGGNTTWFLIKQLMFVVMGLFVTYLFYLMPYTRFSQWAPALLAITVPLLLFTLIFGTNINDARRWITIPFIGFSFQTSEFANVVLIMFTARSISAKQDNINDFMSAFAPIILPIILVCGLIAPTNLSTSLILFATCFLMMFIGRISIKLIITLVISAVFAFALLILIGSYFPKYVRTATWIQRVQDFVNDDDGTYQVQQGKMAMARGGIIGYGPGNSLQRNYLPSPYSDYIYAIIIEEYGLLGGFVILGLYVLLFMRVVKLVTKSPKTFGAMLAIGLSLLITIQALANMAVSVHLVPVTGLTLPFLSLGGTSMLFMSMSLGMILSVSRYVEREASLASMEE